MAKRRLVDVSCKRMQFFPGDRIVARLFGTASPGEIKKVKRMVQNWAGPDVEVLVYDATKMEIQIERGTAGT